MHFPLSADEHCEKSSGGDKLGNTFLETCVEFRAVSDLKN